MPKQIERAALAFVQRKATIERGEAGLIRVACPEPIVYRIMKSALLDRFHARNQAARRVRHERSVRRSRARRRRCRAPLR